MHFAPLLLAGLLALAAPSGRTAAQPVRATYEVYAAGMTVLRLQADILVTPDGYRVEAAFRTSGLAAAFAPGEQTSRAEGAWAGPAVLPIHYHSEGHWRGRRRLITLSWRGGDPTVQAMEPDQDTEREVVPAAARRGTIDALSAFALLSRTVAHTGACEGEAPVFDGRRRSDFIIRTGGREVVGPWRDAWHGPALRCSFEGRLVAGFPRDQAREEAVRPQRGQAWIASPYAGAPPIPVRIEMPSRWFGTAVAVLLRAEPSGGADRTQ